jgi:hypothetical protein
MSQIRSEEVFRNRVGKKAKVMGRERCKSEKEA